MLFDPFIDLTNESASDADFYADLDKKVGVLIIVDLF